jgi:hypothetical protein
VAATSVRSCLSHRRRPGKLGRNRFRLDRGNDHLDRSGDDDGDDNDDDDEDDEDHGRAREHERADDLGHGS